MPTLTLRADLHVHSYHSGYAAHLKVFRTRDCYSDPEAVYRVAKARGMDLVCLTDHDSLDGCLEFLDRHPDAPDFIMGEEIECTLPARTRGERATPGIRVHIGAIGMTERIHRDVQPLRGNVFEVVEYLRQQDVFFALNHLFFFYNGQLPARDYVDALLAVFPALEVRNGAMSREQNALVEEIAAQGAFVGVGGSDAHALRYVGRTWTEAPAATREEFVTALKAGRVRTGGEHGSTSRMMREIYGVIGAYVAGLAGLGRHDLTVMERLIGATLAVASLPGQVTPAIVAVVQKRRERATIRRVREELSSVAPGFSPAQARENDVAASLEDVAAGL